MKKTLVTVLAVLVAVGMVSSSFAQSAGPRTGSQQGQGQRGQGAPGGGQRMQMSPEVQKKIQAAHDKVIKGLKLNANQTKAVSAAVKKRDDATKKMRTQVEADRKAGKQINRDKLQEQGKKIRDTYTAEMKKAMGEANYKKYETQMQAEMKKIFDEMRKKSQAGGKKAGGI